MESLVPLLQTIPPPGFISVWVFVVVLVVLTAGISALWLAYSKSRNHERQTQGDANTMLKQFSRELIDLSTAVAKNDQSVAFELKALAEKIDQVLERLP